MYLAKISIWSLNWLEQQKLVQNWRDRYGHYDVYQHACCVHSATYRSCQAPYQQFWSQCLVSYQSEQLGRRIPYHQHERGVINEKRLSSEVSSLLKAVQYQAQPTHWPQCLGRLHGWYNYQHLIIPDHVHKNPRKDFLIKLSKRCEFLIIWHNMSVVRSGISF